MFDYEKLFEPFTLDGAGLEKSIKWVKKQTEVSDLIMDQTVADTMNMISQGEKFSLPCKCGCKLGHVNVPIEHFMVARATELNNLATKAFMKVIEENERQRIQARMKLISKFDRDYDKMVNGTFWENLIAWNKSPVLKGLIIIQDKINERMDGKNGA